MATFTISHLPGIAALMAIADNPYNIAGGLLTTDTLDAELTRMLTIFRIYSVAAVNPLRSLTKVSEAVQDLAGIQIETQLTEQKFEGNTQTDTHLRIVVG